VSRIDSGQQQQRQQEQASADTIALNCHAGWTWSAGQVSCGLSVLVMTDDASHLQQQEQWQQQQEQLHKSLPCFEH
jgi:hypothetical protein